jgi:hypothetical protein
MAALSLIGEPHAESGCCFKLRWGGVCAFLQQMSLRGKCQTRYMGRNLQFECFANEGRQRHRFWGFSPSFPCFRVFAKGQNQETRVMKVILGTLVAASCALCPAGTANHMD